MSTTTQPTRLLRDRTTYEPVGVPTIWVQVGLGVTFLVGLYTVFIAHQIHDFGAAWTVVLLALALAISIWVTPRHFTVGFLTSLLPFLIVWRIAQMAGGTDVPNDAGGADWTITGPRPWALMIVCAVALVPFVLQFFAVWRNDLRHRTENVWLLNLVWGFTLVRIYFGFNELGHATEKIFAGYDSWAHMTNQVFGPMGKAAVAPFSLLGSAPGFFVVLAGIIEISVGLGVGFGLMTRLAGAGGVAYLLLATLAYGGEWWNGYGWAGAGWEYPMLLIVFFGSFVLTGAGPFSLDHWLLANGRMPHWMRGISVTRSTLDAYEQDSDATLPASDAAAN